MAEYIRHKMPNDYQIVCTSDWHVGSLAFHEDAAKEIVKRVTDEADTFFLFNGDFVEGKAIDSKHFNPQGLDKRHLNIGDQYDYVAELIHPIREKILALGKGNHDMYIERDADIYLRMVRDQLRIPKVLGGYQTWVSLGKHLRIHMYHGQRAIPRGAKDPIQRDANRRAWLKRELEPLAGDCHVQLMGHVHQLMVQEPIQQTALLSSGDNVHRQNFIEPEVTFPGKNGQRVCHVPTGSRWYGITGTLRRGGGFGYIDYSEIAGYGPSEIGYLLLTVRDGRCVDLEKVVL